MYPFERKKGKQIGMKGEKFFIQLKLWNEFIYNVGKKEGREKKNSSDCGKTKTKKR